MKITVVSPYFPPEINGVAISVFHRVKALQDLGHNVQLIIPDYGNNIKDNYCLELLKRKDLLINVISTRLLKELRTKKFPSFMKSGDEIEVYAKIFGPEIIMVDDPFIYLLGSGYIPLVGFLKQANVISVGLCHADVPTTLRKFGRPILGEVARRVIPYTYNKFDLTVFTSHYLKKCYPKIINGCSVTFLGVDNEYFQRSPPKGSKDTIDILYVGRLEPDKDIRPLAKVNLR